MLADSYRTGLWIIWLVGGLIAIVTPITMLVSIYGRPCRKKRKV